MSRGWILLTVALGLLPPAAPAGWFDNREQEAAKVFEAGEYLDAAELFKDDYRRGVAL
jgi:hypothetical protein